MINFTAIITINQYKEYKEEWLNLAKELGIKEITDRTTELIRDNKLVLVVPSFESWLLDRIRLIHKDLSINDITVTYSKPIEKEPEIILLPRGSQVIPNN